MRRHREFRALLACGRVLIVSLGVCIAVPSSVPCKSESPRKRRWARQSERAEACGRRPARCVVGGWRVRLGNVGSGCLPMAVGVSGAISLVVTHDAPFLGRPLHTPSAGDAYCARRQKRVHTHPSSTTCHVRPCRWSSRLLARSFFALARDIQWEGVMQIVPDRFGVFTNFRFLRMLCHACEHRGLLVWSVGVGEEARTGKCSSACCPPLAWPEGLREAPSQPWDRAPA